MTIDVNKVIKGLTCCMNGILSMPKCEECPYADEQGTCDKLDEMHSEALELLKVYKELTDMIAPQVHAAAKEFRRK